jgi:hypothetical protein
MKWFLGMSAVLFCAMQAIQPSRKAPAVNANKDLQAVPSVPSSVKAILGRACYDCHSNRTAWPWYSHVAPVSWLLDRDVQRGRRKLNFSEWTEENDSSRDKAQVKVESTEICVDVERGRMPLRSYRLMHSEARLSRGDIGAICRWAKETARAPTP